VHYIMNASHRRRQRHYVQYVGYSIDTETEDLDTDSLDFDCHKVSRSIRGVGLLE